MQTKYCSRTRCPNKGSGELHDIYVTWNETDILIFVFTCGCTCSQDTTIHTLPPQWVQIKVENRVVASLVDEEMNPMRVVSVGADNILQIKIHGKNLEKCHGLWFDLNNQSLQDVLFKVNECKMCPGIPEEKFHQVRTRYSSGFVDNTTFRSNACMMLVKGPGACPRCVSVRNVLKSYISRDKSRENKPLTHPQRRPFASLNALQKDEKLREQSTIIKNKNRIIYNIRSKLREAKRRGINPKNLGETLRQVMELHKDKMSPLQALFWEEQVKALGAKGPSGRRWSPMMIRLAIHLQAKSSGFYKDLSQIISLPGKTSLYDYTNLFPEKPGVRHHNINSLKEKCKSLPEKHKYFSLMMDEVSIRENLVFCPKTGEIIGFVNLSDIEDEISRLDADLTSSRPQSAKRMLVYMVKGLSAPKEVKQVVGIFGTTSATSQQIYDRTWSVIEAMEMSGLKVLCVVCDGARSNRSFFNLCCREDSDQVEGVTWKTKNIYSEEDENGQRDLFFISDVPHLLKCLRNNFSEDKLWRKGQWISWTAVKKLYYQHKDRTFRKACKLRAEHIELNNFSKMKVYLAAQVMSETVAQNLEDLGDPQLTETISFIRMVDRFFDCLNGSNTTKGKYSLKPDLNPYTLADSESRFHFLTHDVLGEMKKWRQEVEARPGKFSARERKAMTITDETYQGMVITIHSFIAATKFLLGKEVDFVLPRSFCQDDLEQYFGDQRNCGRLNNCPDMKGFLHNDTRIVKRGEARFSLSSVKNQNTTAAPTDTGVVIDQSHLPRRKNSRLRM